MRLRHAAWAVLLWGCSDTEPAGPPEVDELRVSTHRGLEPLVPNTGRSTSALLVALVCPFVDKDLEVKGVAADVYELKRKPESAHTIEGLAGLLRHPGLQAVERHGDTLRVTLKPGANTDLFCLEDGAFSQLSYRPDELVLERRKGRGIRRIRVLNVKDSEEEWRRFLAREVDIVPTVNRQQLRYVQELPSVKLVPVETQSIGLIFNAARVPREIRQAVAAGIHRQAVVRALRQDARAAAAWAEDDRKAAELLAGAPPRDTLSLMTVQGDADMRRAALVIEENLVRLALPIRVYVLDIHEISNRVRAGDFDVWLFYLKPARFFRSGAPQNFSRFSDPALDAAVDAGDEQTGREILERDVAQTPIFQVPDFIAADTRFCGIKPELVDLSWLGDVHLCAPGETE